MTTSSLPFEMLVPTHMTDEHPDIHVLLIEDNLAEARLLQEILKGTSDSQFRLTHVKRLSEAVTQLDTARFSVALLDLTLPDSEGLASLDALIARAPSLPIVVLTSTNDDKLALVAVRRGAQDYLVKRQVNLDILVRSVRYAIERKQSAEALREINETLELRVRERTAALAAANESLRQEVESRQSIQNRLVLAQQAGKIGTFEWDLVADRVTWSIELEALYGLAPGSLQDSHDRLLALIYPEDRYKVVAELDRSLQLKQGLDLEFRIEDPDGNIRWIAVKSSIFGDRPDRLTQTLALAKPLEEKPASHAIGIHMDITEKKQLEQQFLRAQRLESLGTLASGIAHDLNNVLTPILSVAQLLPLRLTDLDDRTQNLLKILESSARRGADLIKQILSFARGIESNRICLQPSHLLVDVQKILQQTLPKSIDIDTDIPADLWTVLGDMTQIHQVLMNLCVNARDAMPHGGTLRIAATNQTIDETFARTHLDAKAGSYVAICVSDTGTGIQPQLLHRIFDPFFTTKEIGKGTGLGLSAVMGIIKTHGGFIDVQSQVVSGAARNEHHGTQIQVYLPTCNTPAPPSENAPELPSGHQQTILVVDDEIAIGELIKTTLETYNYRVLLANNGARAIEIYAQQHAEIAAVLIDMMMPVMDGLTTVTALHQIDPTLPVVAMSGLNSVESIDRAERFGCHHFMAKPFTTSELLQTLAQSLTASGG
jgi:two-component system, cell cycle sensor histidine kinase and response regulator CckA